MTMAGKVKSTKKGVKVVTETSLESPTPLSLWTHTERPTHSVMVSGNSYCLDHSPALLKFTEIRYNF